MRKHRQIAFYHGLRVLNFGDRDKRESRLIARPPLFSTRPRFVKVGERKMQSGAAL